MDNESIFAERLHLCRWKKHMTVAELAREAHTMLEAIRCFEHGQRQPKLNTLARLAQALDVSIDYLAGLTDDVNGGSHGNQSER